MKERMPIARPQAARTQLILCGVFLVISFVLFDSHIEAACIFMSLSFLNIFYAKNTMAGLYFGGLDEGRKMHVKAVNLRNTSPEYGTNNGLAIVMLGVIVAMMVFLASIVFVFIDMKMTFSLLLVATMLQLQIANYCFYWKKGRYEAFLRMAKRGWENLEKHEKNH